MMKHDADRRLLLTGLGIAGAGALARVAHGSTDLLVKTHPADREKIELIKALVADHLDIGRILEVATPCPA